MGARPRVPGGGRRGGYRVRVRRSSRRRRAARSRWGVLVPTLLAVVVLAVVLARTGLPDLTPLPGSPFPPSALAIDAELRIDPARVPTEAAVVAYVLDGDSLVVRLAGRESQIRLYGLNAPERDERCAAQVRARLRRLAPPGATLLLHPGPRNDDGARLLRYAFLEDGRSLDATLVAEGLARAWRRDGQLRDAIVRLEDAARAGRTGCLWGG